MRTGLIGLALLVVGGALIVTGVLPVDSAVAVGQRVWPILLFVVAITVVTELAADAELFRVVAEHLSRWGGGRTWLLWIFVVVLATACTVFLSLDTTAVLLTPVVVLVAQHVGLPPLPFALTTVWLANTASLLLPVSNLTNLLAVHELPGLGPAGFAALMVLPAAVAVVVPCVVILVAFRRQLTGTYRAPVSTAPADRPLLVASAVIILALVPALVSGIPVWIPALVAAGALVVVFAVRRPMSLRFTLVPWRVVLLACGLFLVVEAAHSLGLADALSAISGTGESLLDLLRLEGTGAVGANVANNLPAYLALEPVASSPSRIAALLVGVNAGSLVTPWASLATLLWHERMTGLGVPVSWARYAALGAIVVPITLAGSAFALVLAA